MVVKAWAPNFHFQKELLRVIPLWVRLPNLPLHCWTEDSLSRVGSTLGVPLFADACTSQQLRISFARLLIEMDITQPLPTEIQVEDASGNNYTQPVVYEWKPPFCASCNKVGHNCSQAQKSKPSKAKTVLKWVPKPAQPNSTESVPAVSAAQTGPEVPTTEPSVPIVTTGPASTTTVPPLPVVATPAQPVPQVSSDDDGGWKVVTRRSREVARRVIYQGSSSNSIHTLGKFQFAFHKYVRSVLSFFSIWYSCLFPRVFLLETAL